MRHMEAVPFPETDERFGIRSRFPLGANDAAEVVVLTGDTTLDSLPLDHTRLDAWCGLSKTSPDAFLGVMVDGDLSVADRITNLEWDFGPFLLVRGDVRVRNLATAGSEILVEGDLHVAQTLAGVYNHGRTVVKGDARAEVVVTEQHLTEFHGRLTAELCTAGNFLRIADPARVQVGGWAGYVCDLEGRLLPDVGSRSTRALRALDPDFWDLDGGAILTAMKAGRSLLRTADRQTRAPRSPADAVREVLRLAGCREHDRWDDGFVVDPGRDDEPYEVYFCEADEPDEPGTPGTPGTPGAPETLDPATELTRYTKALAAAGYGVRVDPVDVDVLWVRSVAG
ncbi:hypothetical protein SAMN04487983_1002280 [Streptomyces sp. yr375]|uniref:hypothetical protein n=1 Tax=Streptomyces sp. yr375 TaxID=1761906 RepID=UPI0008C65A0A|nr:hypothetical protein [Streptomyces sp. yr375]SEP96122.1 hypothetical protein SAMN04487983_1002280 [Streptomyces sp. yr375]